MKQSLAALSVLALGATMAFAQAAGPSPVHARAHRRAHFAQELNLTSTQKEQAKAIFHDTRLQLQPLRQQLKQDRQSLRAAVQSGDNAQIQQLSNAMGALEGQVIGFRAAGREKFYSMLTPDQKNLIAQHQQKGE